MAFQGTVQSASYHNSALEQRLTCMCSCTRHVDEQQQDQGNKASNGVGQGRQGVAEGSALPTETGQSSALTAWQVIADRNAPPFPPDSTTHPKWSKILTERSKDMSPVHRENYDSILPKEPKSVPSKISFEESGRLEKDEVTKTCDDRESFLENRIFPRTYGRIRLEHSGFGEDASFSENKKRLLEGEEEQKRQKVEGAEMENMMSFVQQAGIHEQFRRER